MQPAAGSISSLRRATLPATGGGTINVQSAGGNSVTTGTGTAISLGNGITIGSSNFQAGNVDVNGAAVGVQLTNVTGGTGITGGVIQNTTTAAVDINGGTGSINIASPVPSSIRPVGRFRLSRQPRGGCQRYQLRLHDHQRHRPGHALPGQCRGLDQLHYRGRKPNP